MIFYLKKGALLELAIYCFSSVTAFLMIQQETTKREEFKHDSNNTGI